MGHADTLLALGGAFLAAAFLARLGSSRPRRSRAARRTVSCADGGSTRRPSRRSIRATATIGPG
ncbi:hypothetical protein AB0N31_24935 [Streptomyces sp. NPDC051051]|uniref:hypothetical protein n=1 Tax=Streptomyces sp. NPDC051051 TaxID=3155666 RepID=UPI003440A434